MLLSSVTLPHGHEETDPKVAQLGGEAKTRLVVGGGSRAKCRKTLVAETVVGIAPSGCSDPTLLSSVTLPQGHEETDSKVAQLGGEATTRLVVGGGSRAMCRRCSVREPSFRSGVLSLSIKVQNKNLSKLGGEAKTRLL
ncbi:hypothetical protein PIB30_087896, partial [Stylosanthes scabra]|nr:hypothetical protein [Stylosanthes scabra]